MREGKWRINGEPICFDKEGNLINGQHRLEAVVSAQVPIVSLVVRGVDAEAFVTYDAGLTRKLSHVFACKGVLNACSISGIVSKYMVLKYTNATPTGNNTTTHSTFFDQRKTKQESLEEYFADPDFFQEVHRFSQSAYTRLRLMSQGVMGGYVAYLIKEKKHSPEKVYEFFTALSTEGAWMNTAVATLRAKLYNNMTRSPNMRMSAVYIHQLIIKTWNAYLKGKTIKCLKWDSDVEGKLQFE